MRIALLAPPWIPVPPPGYGGVEAVVALLANELHRRGHAVTLFAAPGSHSDAEVRTLLDRAHPDEIERSLYEADHVARAFAAIDAAGRAGRPFDVVHDHCGFVTLAMADRLSVPVVHTLHGPFTPATSAFYAHHAGKAQVVAISQTQLDSAPAGLRAAGVVPNPIDARDWPLVEAKGDYLLWVGRMAPVKGPHRAVEAARLAGMPLVLAGPVQPGQEAFFEREVRPHIDGHRVRYAGEIAGERKRRLFANARALLMPIRWPEPFGMVMVEAMVCGTPVIAFAAGAATELVREGVTGLLVEDEADMARACLEVAAIDPVACRESVVERFDVRRVAALYEAIYRRAAAARAVGASLVPATALSAGPGASSTTVGPPSGASSSTGLRPRGASGSRVAPAARRAAPALGARTAQLQRRAAPAGAARRATPSRRHATTSGASRSGAGAGDEVTAS